MVFGYMVVQRLLVLVKVFSRLPDGVSRVFARSLNAAITPFNIINYRLLRGRPGLQPPPDGRKDGPGDRLVATQTCARKRRQLASRHAFPDTGGPVLQGLHDGGRRLSLPGKHSDFHKRQQT
jgi:hypothetical protein